MPSKPGHHPPMPKPKVPKGYTVVNGQVVPKSYNNPGSKKKSAGRPKAPFFKRAPKQYKVLATGETRNSPMTDPNVIFWLGIVLIVFAGWSSGRIKRIFAIAWIGEYQNDTSHWADDIKQTGSQFLFLFLLVITARAIPPLARVYLVMLIGVWILYLMKNPEVLKLLAATADNNSLLNTLQSQITGGPPQLPTGPFPNGKLTGMN